MTEADPEADRGSPPQVTSRPAPRHRRPAERRRIARSAGVTLVACGVLATALGLGGWVLASRADAPRPVGPAAKVAVPHGLAGQPSLSRHGRGVRVARPVRLVIPAIGVSTSLSRLGLTSAHTLQVPASPAVAGWYTGSPRPGAVGSSVIAGHIDSRTGPGVFYRLRKLRRGQHVYVVRADHTVAVFRVTAVRSYPKDQFPRATIYGPVPDAELRLITCGGLFDYATGSYLSNVVVYTTLIRHTITRGRNGRGQ